MNSFTAYVLYGQMFDVDKYGYITSDGNGRFWCTENLFEAMRCSSEKDARILIKCIQPYNAKIYRLKLEDVENK